VKRFIAKMMRLSFGPTGSDLFSAASKKKRTALRKLCMRKWKNIQTTERAAKREAAKQLGNQADSGQLELVK
jgi:hypothetical protein